MIERVDQAMRALQASFFARTVYFQEHAAVARELRNAMATLQDVLRETERVTVFNHDDRLVCNGVPLPSESDLRQGLFAHLRQHGVEQITFHRGLPLEELEALLDQVQREDGEVVGSAHVRVGGVFHAGSEEEQQAGGVDIGHRLREHSRIIRDAWRQLVEPSRLDLSGLAGVVADICTTVAASNEVLLPLAALKNHDEYTFIHTVNVGVLSAAFCEVLGFSPDQVRDATTAALLHDVGKQMVPPELLSKPAALTPQERRLMERHPADGARILLRTSGLPEMAPVVAFEHHLNLDLSGYPVVPAGHRPHLTSQIVQIADVFDALRSDRPYRGALPSAEAERIIRDRTGAQIDATLVDIFFERIARYTDREIEAQRARTAVASPVM
jgi:putative nucleotidyltransferase with HDIG domain